MKITSTQKIIKLIAAGILALAACSVLSLNAQEYKFKQNEDGVVVMEAEHYSEMVTPDTNHWVFDTVPANYSGEGCMRGVSDKSFGPAADAMAGAPALVYYVEFEEFGEHYIWARASNNEFNWGGSDSYHAGVNETILDGGTFIRFEGVVGDYVNGTWGWIWQSASGPATVEVPSPGTHEVWIYLREPRFAIDKIVLSIDPYEDGAGFFPWVDSTNGPGLDETLDHTGIFSAKLNPDGFSVHPNPAGDMVQIYIHEGVGSDNKLEIFDITGKMIRSISADYRSHLSLDVRELAAGLYYIRMESGPGTVSVRKLIKK